jgi:hypothetical protein
MEVLSTSGLKEVFSLLLEAKSKKYLAMIKKL